MKDMAFLYLKWQKREHCIDHGVHGIMLLTLPRLGKRSNLIAFPVIYLVFGCHHLEYKKTPLDDLTTSPLNF